MNDIVVKQRARNCIRITRVEIIRLGLVISLVFLSNTFPKYKMTSIYHA